MFPKIVETYSLPTLILNIDYEQNHAKGSARSIEQVSMFEILSAHQDLISKFGGHHMAAGMTMDIDNIDELRTGLNDWMARLSETTSLEPSKNVDVLLDESDITIKNIRDIQKLRPFGTDFTSPLFEIRDIAIKSLKAIGKEQNHLKMTLGESNLVSLFWQNGAYASQLEIGQPVNLIGNLQINEWNGNQTPQFMVQDIAMDTLQILDYRSKSKNTDFLNNDETTAFMIQSKAQKLNENEFYYGETVPDHFDKMVLRDLPMTLDELKLTLQQTQISQVYIVFQHIKLQFILKVCLAKNYLKML